MNAIDTTTATKINELHNDIETLLHQGIEKAIEIGQLLTAKKTELQHGEFGTWIKDNLIFSDRTARRYMQLFENKSKALESGSISEAYKMLAEPKTDTVSVLDYKTIEEGIINIIGEIDFYLSLVSEFWEEKSNSLPDNILEFENIDLSSFELNEFNEGRVHSLMTEYKDYALDWFVSNNPPAANKEEWESKVKFIGLIRKFNLRTEKSINEICLNKGALESQMRNVQRLCNQRIFELNKNTSDR